MIDPNHPIFADIMTLRKAVQDNLAIARPTAFNKMQLDELRYLLTVYENELKKITSGHEVNGREALEKDVEGRANYERHSWFKPINRGL